MTLENGIQTDRPKLVVIGESLMDIIVGRDGMQSVHPGGSPMNVAVGLGRLGNDVTLMTRLGEDDHGRIILDHLQESSVRTDVGAGSLIRTSRAFATRRSDGSDTYSFDFDWDITGHSVPRNADIVHTGSLVAAIEPSSSEVLQQVRNARGRGLVTFDPNIRPDIWASRAQAVDRMESFFAEVNVVKLSDEDGRWLYPQLHSEDVTQRILRLGPSLVVMTRGENGALLAAGSVRTEVPAPPADVVDTIGAGDSYMAGLIHFLAEEMVTGISLAALRGGFVADAGWLSAIGSFAAACAAETVKREGADPPWLQDLPATISQSSEVGRSRARANSKNAFYGSHHEIARPDS